MPSGYNVEVLNPADGDASILDASDLMLAVAAHPPSSSSANDDDGVADAGEARRGEDADGAIAVDDDCGDVGGGAGGAHHVSPMPPKSKAGFSGKKASGGSSKSSSESSSSSSAATTVAPRTPSASVGTVAPSGGVTPGESTAKKKKKKGKKSDDEGKVKPTMTKKKTVNTLHSFFGKADPSAKSSKVKVVAPKAKKAPAVDRASSKVYEDEAHPKKTAGMADEPASDLTSAKGKSKRLPDDVDSHADRSGAKSATPSSKGAKPSFKANEEEEKKKKKAAEPKAKKKPQRVSSDTDDDAPPAVDEMDDSPSYAVSAALLRAGNGRRRKRKKKHDEGEDEERNRKGTDGVDGAEEGAIDATVTTKAGRSESLREASAAVADIAAQDADATEDASPPADDCMVVEDAAIPVDEDDDVVEVVEAAAEVTAEANAAVSEGKVAAPKARVEKVADAAAERAPAEEDPAKDEDDAAEESTTTTEHVDSEAAGDDAPVERGEDEGDTTPSSEGRADSREPDEAEVETVATEGAVEATSSTNLKGPVEEIAREGDDSEDDATVALDDASRECDDNDNGEGADVTAAATEVQCLEGSDDDATVDMDEPAAETSTDPTEVDVEENVDAFNDSTETDKSLKTTGEGPAVVVDTALINGDSANQISNDEVPKEAFNETPEEDDVEVVEAKPKKGATKKSSAKSAKSKTAAASATKKSSKGKNCAAPLDKKSKKGLSPLAASFQKMAAMPLKKANKKVLTAVKKDEALKVVDAAAEVNEKPGKGEGPPPIVAALKKQAHTSPPKEKKQVVDVVVLDGSKDDDTAAASLASTAKSATPNTTMPPAAKLSEEDESRLRRYRTLREKYVARATELGNRPSEEDFVEESPSLDGAQDLPVVEKGSVEVGEDGDFPDKLLVHLLLAVQGRSRPLSALAKEALDDLSPYTTATRSLTIECISSKIKLLAQRKSYLSGKPPAPSQKLTPITKLDCFENTEECYMWRWELVSVDLLPAKEVTKVKKARTMRKKLQGHHKAIMNLIASVDKVTAWLQTKSDNSAKTTITGEKLKAAVSAAEEKVLKFEREEEKARLVKEAILLKQKSKADKLAEKLRQKEAEKKRQQEERAHRKAEAAKEREASKAKKEAEKLKKEAEKLKKQQEIEEKENKRKAGFLSFFGGAKKKQKIATSSVSKDEPRKSMPTFDGDTFRKLINSSDTHVDTHPFAKCKMSARSRASMRPKTANVRVSVFVTVLSENAFAPQPYDEERVITVPNRYKFLGFHEDVRPPYRGTWSKTSSLVTGRRPFGKDTQFLDYENDSEAEWEEGDDEEGEDLQEEGDGNDDEEDDVLNEDDNDGWLAAEDDLGIEDEDEETRALRKKNLFDSNSLSSRPNNFKACVVGPRMGGLSHKLGVDNTMHGLIEGFSPQDAMDALNSHVGCVITPEVSAICLDAFPPSDPVKDVNQAKKDSTAQNKEMTVEAQGTMAKFVHNCTQYKSKDNLITELLRAHPSITNSRAQAMRELDVIAEKRRLSGGGVVWEVKENWLKKLELKKKDLRKAPKEVSPSKKDEGDKPKKEKKDPLAPKKKRSAYNLYFKAKHNDVKAANPDKPTTEITTILAANFKALTPEELAPWEEKAAADKLRYEEEMASYTATKASIAPPKAPSDSSTSPPSDDAAAKQAPKSQPNSKTQKKKRKAEAVACKKSAALFASFIKQKKPKKTE